jgi:hypothetical protein
MGNLLSIVTFHAIKNCVTVAGIVGAIVALSFLAYPALLMMAICHDQGPCA